ncbi:transposase [Paenibacillus sp. GP183]|uniref:transposase n=1 Tax=Paenibacillus sp. GP183 TaxID=1882751 RepID=UPI000B293241
MLTRRSSPSAKASKIGHSNWGAKFDAFGNKITWFGYKLHLAVDTKSELPIALEVTPAHVNDGEMAPGLIEKVATKSNTRFFMLDAGYDQMKVYEAARNVKAQAIIPLNPRGEK